MDIEKINKLRAKAARAAKAYHGSIQEMQLCFSDAIDFFRVAFAGKYTLHCPLVYCPLVQYPVVKKVSFCFELVDVVNKEEASIGVWLRLSGCALVIDRCDRDVEGLAEAIEEFNKTLKPEGF